MSAALNPKNTSPESGGISFASQLFTDVLTFVASDPQKGLTQSDVDERKKMFGLNTHRGRRASPFIEGIRSTLFSPLSIVLIICAIVSFLLESVVNGSIILFVVLCNTLISITQERKSSRVFAQLDSYLTHTVSVVRDGKQVTIAREDVVPGDILVLTGGNLCGADARVIEAHDLKMNESSVTGESRPVAKTTKPSLPSASLLEQNSMVFAGSYVAEGYGKAVVVRIGKNTQLLQGSSDIRRLKTPLEEQLGHFSVTLLVGISVVALCIVLMGISRDIPLSDILLIAIAVAVGAVPEGLPAILTLILVSSMKRLSLRGGLIKHLSSAETFGAVTHILVDKTGTLTTGDMSISSVVTYHGPEQLVHLSDAGRLLLRSAVYASDAVVEWDTLTKSPVPTFVGRPIEAAIVKTGFSIGIDQRECTKESHLMRLQFVQFEPTRRYAVSLNEHPTDGARIYLSGSPEHILLRSSLISLGKQTKQLTETDRSKILASIEHFSERGARLTAVAYRVSSDRHISEDILDPHIDHPIGFVFCGLIVFEDTVRPDVKDALLAATNAHIRVIMATGDHFGSAEYVGSAVGLMKSGQKAVLGDELDQLTDEEVYAKCISESVFARLTPQHKMRLAHIIQDNGGVVAMTGDGINDVLTLQSADIGITPESGTGIAKDSADLILIKNSFSIITAAIHEGRHAIDVIRSVIMFLLVQGLSMAIFVGGSIALGVPLPLLALQILWINIIQEITLATSFTHNPPRESLMNETPPSRTTGFISVRHWAYVGTMAVISALVYTLTQYVLIRNGYSESSINISMYLVVCVSIIALSFSFRDISQYALSFKRKKNSAHRKAVFVSLILIAVSMSVPPFSALLQLTLPPLETVFLAGIVAGVLFSIAELFKFLFRLTRVV